MVGARRGRAVSGPQCEEFVGVLQDNFTLNWVAAFIGGLGTWGMMAARARFSWFPFHPVGYIMFTPFAITTLWFSIFLGWLIKSLVTRFGGTDSYRKLVPLFLGLVLGEVVMMLLWLGIDGWQERSGHLLMPG
jgi:hypothetical protein